MPELPEIETIKTGLAEKILNRLILSVEVGNESVIRNRKQNFIAALSGHRIGSVERRGKMLIFEIKQLPGEKKQHHLLARLGMTGRLVYFGPEDTLWGSQSFKDKKSFTHKHCHVVFTFQKEGVLLFCDTRRFGYMEIVDDQGLEEKLRGFGLEPLGKDFTLPAFRSLLGNKKTNIKALLLNQRYVAGIGNIYADEILFEARVSPCRQADDLAPEEIKNIYQAIRKVLKQAVANRGTTFSDYVDADGNRGSFQKRLKVYGRGGEGCLRCPDAKISKIRIGGRGTCFCERCQK